MKDKNCNVCPGCRKHCPADKPRCKYGRAYFSKNAAEEKKYKWEKYVERDGLAWRFLMTSRRMKKGIRKGKISEDRFFAALSPAEQKLLAELLNKLDFGALSGG